MKTQIDHIRLFVALALFAAALIVVVRAMTTAVP